MTEKPVGLGCMRLSAAGVAEEDALATLDAALGAGATLLDTAGAYGPEADPHANERLVARALARREGVTVASKGGLTRVGEHYVADGRAKTLRAQCEASVEALGRPIDLYLLHAVDPRVALETSVRALAGLQRDGLVRAIGVSNVSRAELDRACDVAELAAVEVALSPFDDDAVRGGLIARCVERGLRVLAHSPLGGPARVARLAADPALARVGVRHGVSAAAVAVAWLRDLASCIVPIPGARTPEHAVDVVGAARLVLDERDRAELDARFAAGRLLRAPPASRRPHDDADGDVRLVMGIQGSGKSTFARRLVDRGYERLNRDELGGTLRGLVRRLDELLGRGLRHVVLDNTYASRAARSDVVETAWRHGVPVRCTWLDVPLEVAQARVARRILEAHGRLLEPAELDRGAKNDPAIVPPRALFGFRRELEAPSLDEGFHALDVVRLTPSSPTAVDADALLVALDVVAIRDGDTFVVDGARLAALRARAPTVGVLGWTPVASDVARGSVERLRAALDGVELRTCAHGGGPPVCWCRPPLPGLAIAFLAAHGLDGARCTLVGTSAHHRTIAAAIGARYEDA